MKLNIYAIYDTAAAVYQRPFTSQSDGEVTRTFSDIACDAEHPIGQHPEDYSLHRIGSFNDQDGKIIAEDRECIATALELVALTRQPKQHTLAAVTADEIQELGT